jgi:hypothetical protein
MPHVDPLFRINLCIHKTTIDLSVSKHAHDHRFCDDVQWLRKPTTRSGVLLRASVLLNMAFISKENLRNTVCFQNSPNTTTCAFSCCKIKLHVQNDDEDDICSQNHLLILPCGPNTQEPTPSSNGVSVSLLFSTTIEHLSKIPRWASHIWKCN